MDNGASSYRRFLDGDNKGLSEIVRDYSERTRNVPFGKERVNGQRCK